MKKTFLFVLFIALITIFSSSFININVLEASHPAPGYQIRNQVTSDCVYTGSSGTCLHTTTITTHSNCTYLHLIPSQMECRSTSTSTSSVRLPACNPDAIDCHGSTSQRPGGELEPPDMLPPEGCTEGYNLKTIPYWQLYDPPYPSTENIEACVPSYCPAGKRLLVFKCVPTNCNPGSSVFRRNVLYRGTCIPCSRGVVDGGRCVNTCASSAKREWKLCVPTYCNRFGQIEWSGSCITAHCPEGERLVEINCIPIGCPAGFAAVNSLCVETGDTPTSGSECTEILIRSINLNIYPIGLNRDISDDAKRTDTHPGMSAIFIGRDDIFVGLKINSISAVAADDETQACSNSFLANKFSFYDEPLTYKNKDRVRELSSSAVSHIMFGDIEERISRYMAPGVCDLESSIFCYRYNYIPGVRGRFTRDISVWGLDGDGNCLEINKAGVVAVPHFEVEGNDFNTLINGTWIDCPNHTADNGVPSKINLDLVYLVKQIVVVN